MGNSCHKKAHKELIFKGIYKDYDSFYDENKPEIYKTIFELFKGFKDKRKKTLVLYLSAKIKDLEWETTFTFHRDEFIILKRDIMPFFELIEEFELCGEINSFCKDFTN